MDKVAVVDFGGQYAHLIATKVRQLGVGCDIKDPQDPLESFRPYKGILLSGSPALASENEESNYTRAIFDLDVPILGFCFGHQEIAKRYGGEVQATQREYGPADLHLVARSPILRGLGPVERVWMSHGDTVTKLPPGFVELGYSTVGLGDKEHRNAAIGCDALRRYGFQYHAEVDDTVHGREMLANFVFDVCGCRADWNTANLLERILADIRETVGDRHVLVLASGGVDSTVTAKLLAMALGTERLWLLHIDHGLMRKNESAEVMELLRGLGLGAALHFVDASEEFLKNLAGVTDPEQKRRIIGDTFLEVTDREARKLDLAGFVLGQGTIYPDTIETGGTKRADVIKTHHNRVPVIAEMIRAGRVVEPLRELYKPEVRELARRIGIAEHALERHPFPGPGLGIRVLCARGPVEDDVAAAEAALRATLSGSGLKGSILPIRSVGVKADLRAYERPVLLQGPDPGHDRLLGVATRVYKEVPGINRCVFDVSARPLGALEVVPATLTRRRLDLARELDAFFMAGLERHGLAREIWQSPTVLVPLSDGGRGSELVVLRPIHSERGMTARPAALPAALIEQFVAFAAGFPEVTGVVLDVTTKPPGTIEWE